MATTERLRWWDKKTGTDYIADRSGRRWVLSAREYQEVQWYEVQITPEMRQKIKSLRKAQTASRELKAQAAASRAAA